MSRVYRISINRAGVDGASWFTDCGDRVRLDGRAMIKQYQIYLEDDGGWSDSLADAMRRGADQLDAMAATLGEQALQLRKKAREEAHA